MSRSRFVRALVGLVALVPSWTPSLARAQAAPEPAAEAEPGAPEPGFAPEAAAEGASDTLGTVPQDRRHVYSLEDFLAAAERTYPSLRAAASGIEAAEARLDEARVSPFFQFNVEGGAAIAPPAQGTPIYTTGGQLGNLGDPWGPVLSASVSGAIPLFTGGKLRGAWEAARAGVDAAEHLRDRSLAQVKLDVRRAFYGLQLALDIQQMLSEGQGKLERALVVLIERIEGGDTEVDPLDRYRLAAAVAEVQARASQATYLERAARAALTTLTGVEDFEIADCPIAPVEVEVAPLVEYVGRIDHRPEILALSAGIRARRAEVTIHRGRYYPDLVLAAGANVSYGPRVTNITNPFIQDRANNQGFGIGLGARWSLDVWGNVYRVRRADAQVRELEAQTEEARRGASLEVRLARERVDDAVRRMQAWGEGARQGRAWFVSAAQGYEVGATETRTLVDSVRAYFTSRLAHLEAIHDHNVALAQLERSTGTPVVPSRAWEPGCDE